MMTLSGAKDAIGGWGRPQKGNFVSESNVRAGRRPAHCVGGETSRTQPFGLETVMQQTLKPPYDQVQRCNQTMGGGQMQQQR
eukprot:1165275-Pyramimonas_sp.AAC.1